MAFYFPQHFLYFKDEPHGHGSFLGIFLSVVVFCGFGPAKLIPSELMIWLDSSGVILDGSLMCCDRAMSWLSFSGPILSGLMPNCCNNGRIVLRSRLSILMININILNNKGYENLSKVDNRFVRSNFVV